MKKVLTSVLLSSFLLLFGSCSSGGDEDFNLRFSLIDAPMMNLKAVNVTISSGRQAEAVMYLREARRVRPDYLAAAVNLGDLYLEQARIEEARKEFNSALEIDRNSAPARYGLGQAAMSSRDFAKAAGHFEKVLELVPEANRVHYSLAMAYRGLGQRDKAASELKLSGSVGVRPPDPLWDGLRELVQGERLPVVRGRMAIAAGRFADAAAEFQKAVDANPKSIAARVNLAAAKAQMGQPWL